MYQNASPRIGQRFFAQLLVCCWLFVAAGSVHAHAVVTESSLAHEPIKPNHATTVVLFFNAGVELALSRVFLVSKGDVFHPAEIQKGKKPGEVRIKLPGLDPGDYALKYKVFAADGHFTESVIRFNVSDQR